MIRIFFALCSLWTWPLLSQSLPGNWLLPPVVDATSVTYDSNLYDSLVVVNATGGTGVVNLRGDWVLPAQIQSVTLLSCGWIHTKVGNAPKLYNNKGQLVADSFDRFWPLEQGVVVVSKNKKHGALDMNGKWVVPMTFDAYRYTTQGLSFSSQTDTTQFNLRLPPSRKPTYEVKKELQRSQAAIPGYTLCRRGDYSGFLNAKGDTVVPASYILGDVHPKGYMVVSFEKTKWGVIDIKHKTLYPVTAERIGKWTNTLLLPIKQDGDWSVRSFPGGKEVIPAGLYDKIEVYDREKDIFSVTKNGLTGLVNRKGEVILPCLYTFIADPKNLTRPLGLPDKRYTFWYPPTNYISPVTYKWIKNWEDSLIIVYQDTSTALLNAKNGKEIIPPSRFDLQPTGPYFDAFKQYRHSPGGTFKDRMHALYDRKGRLVQPMDSCFIYVVWADSTYWVWPHHQHPSPNVTHFDKNGKPLFSAPKAGAKPSQYGYETKAIMNGEGIEQALPMWHPTDDGTKVPYDKVTWDYKIKCFLTTYKDKTGIVDGNGKVHYPPIFDAVKPGKPGFIYIKHQGKWGILRNPFVEEGTKE